MFLVKEYNATFFFSSRRRHTRSLRDWSSDVCSSDLGGAHLPRRAVAALVAVMVQERLLHRMQSLAGQPVGGDDLAAVVRHREREAGEVAAAVEQHGARSEERRVGKERRARGQAEKET